MTADNFSSTKICSCCGVEKLRAEFFKCKACRDGLRGECKKCVAEKQKAYNSENAERISARKKSKYWTEPEKMREIARAYAEKNADRARDRAKARYWRYRDAALEANALYRKINAEKIKERRTARRKEKGDALREQSRNFYKRNKERMRPQRKAAKAMRRSALGSVTKQDVETLLHLQKWRCAACKADVKKVGYHLDHIFPLSKGGTNDRNNLQILCPACNLSKSAKHPIDFMQSIGMLL